MSTKILITILLCGLVTWLSRVVPFALVKSVTIPRWLVDFLSFVPITIMMAILMESLLVAHPGHFPGLNVENILATIPAALAGVLTKSLLAVVIVGVIAMALLRLIGFA